MVAHLQKCEVASNHAFSHSYNSPTNGGRGKKMLPYYAPENLEKLLESLFADDDELSEEVVVLGRPIPFALTGNCCVNNYGSYGG